MGNITSKLAMLRLCCTYFAVHIISFLAVWVWPVTFMLKICLNKCDIRISPLLSSAVTHCFTTSVPHCAALNGFLTKTKEYTGRKLVGFSMEQMYDVVADVGKYKYFLPFCKKSDVLIHEPEFLKAKLVIGFPPITESYTSNVTLKQPKLVKAECSDGILFDHLTTTWQFSPGLKSQPQTCVIDFYVSFKFRSSFHSHLAHLFFNELVRQMEGAFFEEARKRYGPPIIHTLKLVEPKS